VPATSPTRRISFNGSDEVQGWNWQRVSLQQIDAEVRANARRRPGRLAAYRKYRPDTRAYYPEVTRCESNGLRWWALRRHADDSGVGIRCRTARFRGNRHAGLKDLHCFVCVYDLKGFARAAVELRTSSRTCRRASAGWKRRSAPAVREIASEHPAHPGEIMYRYATRVLAEVTELEAAMPTGRSPRRERLGRSPCRDGEFESW